MTNPKHKCGTELREATYRELEELGQEYLSGDHGKVWVCDKCHVYITCEV